MCDDGREAKFKSAEGLQSRGARLEQKKGKEREKETDGARENGREKERKR